MKRPLSLVALSATMTLVPVALAAELSVSVVPLAIDLSAQGADFADLQLLFKSESDETSQGVSPQTDLTAFELYVVGTDAKDQQSRALAAFTLEPDEPQGPWRQAFARRLNPQVSLLQIAQRAAGSQLFGYANNTLQGLDNEGGLFQPLLDLPSIYRAKAVDLDASVEIARDLTGDGLDDLLVPDFAGWRFSQATSEGGFTETQLFGPKPFMNVGSARYVNFTAHTPYIFDYNQDNLTDVAFWDEGALQVYLQSPEGGFSTTPKRLEVAPNIESDAFFSLSVGTDEDNPTGRQVLLDAIEDLDGDGLPEMVVYSVTGDGLFGKETRYEIHRGRLDAQQTLTFEDEASSLVGSGGIQIDVERRDLNGDGTLEMMVTSFDLGIGSIIRGLLSRTANLQLAIYEMRDGRYAETPALTRKVTAKLDIGNGDIFVPAVLAGDVDGDGLKDLLVQDGDDSLKVFLGQPGKRMFARQPETLDVELPLGNGDVQVVNLDGDADDDLLLVFDADKSEKRQPRIHALRFSQAVVAGGD